MEIYLNPAARVIQYLNDHPDQYKILNASGVANAFADLVDHFILKEILNSGLKKPILVTNDKIFQLQAGLQGIKSEIYQESVPFKSEAEYYTGFVSTEEDAVPNAFRWNEQGKPVFLSVWGEKLIDYQHKIWNVTPHTIYQNLALELMTTRDIHILSIQSEAGYGKSFLALAAALYLVLQKKCFEKVYVIKPMIEIGQKLGYLPGKIEEKMEPYTRYISDLMIKLHNLRPANKMFVEAESYPPYLNQENNGLNWVVKKFKGSKIYSHLVLKGEKSRGPITDLVINSGL